MNRTRQSTGLEIVPHRIRVGVTGHRSLPRAKEIAALVRRVLDSGLEGLVDSTSQNEVQNSKNRPMPFSVISSLAEGADRLVAREVLKREGSVLQAVLPLAVDEYVKDFETAQSKQEFFELLNRCQTPKRARYRRRNDDSLVIDPAELRRDAYAAAGLYIVNHCDVLIAIWDGRPSQGRGGTADVVAYAHEHGRLYIRIWADDDETIEVVKGKATKTTSVEGSRHVE